MSSLVTQLFRGGQRSVYCIHQKPKIQIFLFSLRVHAKILAIRNLKDAKLKNGDLLKKSLLLSNEVFP